MKIELTNVGFSYTNQSIIQSCNIQFQSGQKVCLLGDNGAGKTTFLKILSTLYKPTHGTIVYSSTDTNLELDVVRKKMGVHLDSSHLLKYFTVLENLRIYLKLYRCNSSDTDVHSWLERFQVLSKKDTLVQHLSQGEQKKVSMIKAFLHDPDIMIFDEPTNSLDEESKNTLSNIFASVHKQKLLIVSTHDRSWAKEWRTHEMKIAKGLLA